MNFELSAEQQQIKETASQILKRFAAQSATFKQQILKEKKFPQPIWDAMAEAGFLGSLIPEEYGGSNMGLLALTLAIEEMGANGYGNPLLILTAMDALCILRNGSEPLKKRFLPQVAEGKIKICFALTEPDAGSNTFRIKTFATRNGDTYKIRGQKVFITGVDAADYILLVTRTMTLEEVKSQGLPKPYGLSLFLVDTRSKGLEKRPIPMHGIEGTYQYMLFFDDMEVPAENLVGEEHHGAMALFNSLNPERILASASALGIIEHVLKLSVEYAKNRKVFGGTPIGSHQSIQHPLAEVKIESEAARLLTYRAAWTFDQQAPLEEIGKWANMAKYTAAETAIKAVDRAIETLGGYGFSEEYGIIYYWETARLLRTAPITKEMILNFMSEHVLGLPRSY